MWGHIKRNNHKFIYARSVSILNNDDDAASSVCFPVSAIRGFIFVNSTAMIVRYESPYQYAMNDNDDNDGLLVTFVSSEFIEHLLMSLLESWLLEKTNLL